MLPSKPKRIFFGGVGFRVFPPKIDKSTMVVKRGPGLVAGLSFAIRRAIVSIPLFRLNTK